MNKKEKDQEIRLKNYLKAATISLSRFQTNVTIKTGRRIQRHTFYSSSRLYTTSGMSSKAAILAAITDSGFSARDMEKPIIITVKEL
ncbi:MAG: hypothetical protein NT096_00135 [Proteobacteria bacterium]|nr:hypothetical protein [Pseudomonadota bacterium]